MPLLMGRRRCVNRIGENAAIIVVPLLELSSLFGVLVIGFERLIMLSKARNLLNTI